MGKDGKTKTRTPKKGFWGFIDNIEGDKVVWIIVFLLIMISILAIFSSTSLLKEGSKDRMDFVSEHLVIVGIGLGLIFGLYNIKKIGIFRLNMADFDNYRKRVVKEKDAQIISINSNNPSKPGFCSIISNPAAINSIYSIL